MKEILVTRVNIHVGNQFAEWVEQYPDNYIVVKVSLRDNVCREIDLSLYDSILHVTGIAHVSTDSEMEALYYKVNRDLTIEVAEAAKKQVLNNLFF